jgi:hypothetical protein
MGKILIKIDKAGNPIIETEGFLGSECEHSTKSLLEKFGGEGDLTYKPEYFEEHKDENFEIN